MANSPFPKTTRQKLLEYGANRILAKAGAFKKREVYEEEYVPFEPEMITAQGLTPIWHGRA